MKKRTLLLTSLILLGLTTVKAQWTSPSSGYLKTGDFVSIEGVLVSGLPGSTPPPMFQVKSLTNVTTPFTVDHNRVDISNSTLFINTGDFYIKRSPSATALQVLSYGNLTLSTNGAINPNIGFFINSRTRNFFRITETDMLYSNATQELFKVDANGTLSTRKAIVTLTNPFPDYVFENSYKLKPLSELALFIGKYKHLPNVPSAEDIAANKNQIDVGEMQVKLLEKIEELHLYVLQQQAQIDKQQKEAEQQQKEIEALKAKLAE
ncbi:MAG: hypothetical protein V4620_05580 [Bacteroidota bacterium]